MYHYRFLFLLIRSFFCMGGAFFLSLVLSGFFFLSLCAGSNFMMTLSCLFLLESVCACMVLPIQVKKTMNRIVFFILINLLINRPARFQSQRLCHEGIGDLIIGYSNIKSLLLTGWWCPNGYVLVHKIMCIRKNRW